MSVIDRIRESAEVLTRAENQLIRQMLASPRDVALGTASELAQRIGVHEATASRLARKLGYPNYAGFRAAIREEFIIRPDPADRVRNTLSQGTEAGLLSDLVQQEIEALARMDRYLDDAVILAAAQALIAARRVFVFASGNASALAALMERRLRRVGLNVTLLSGDGRDLAEQSLGMRAGDALLAFAFRRQPRHYGPLIAHAASVGGTSIVIAGTIGPSLQPAANHLLFAPRSGSQDGFQTLTVPMAICNALVLGMAKVDPKVSLDNLKELGRLIDIFE